MKRYFLILVAILSAMFLSSEQAHAGDPSGQLLTPDNAVLLLVDHQPQMAFAMTSHDAGDIVNNTVGLAKAAKTFDLPTVLTTVAAQSFSGPLFEELQQVFPEQTPIDRTTMNTWEDDRVTQRIAETGRKKLIIAGLWTEVCVAMPALSAIEDGYEVYVVTDASGGVTREAHDRAVDRMVQAGAIPVTWLQVMLELQRDWARQETYGPVNEIVQEHARAYGLGVFYVRAMLGTSGEGGN